MYFSELNDRSPVAVVTGSVAKMHSSKVIVGYMCSSQATSSASTMRSGRLTSAGCRDQYDCQLKHSVRNVLVGKNCRYRSTACSTSSTFLLAQRGNAVLKHTSSESEVSVPDILEVQLVGSKSYTSHLLV